MHTASGGRAFPLLPGLQASECLEHFCPKSRSSSAYCRTLKIARAICEGKHGATEAAASFLIGLIPRIDAERELFCDFCHPSHGSPFIPFRSAREKSVRFAPTPPPNFTPLPFLTSRRAEMIDT